MKALALTLAVFGALYFSSAASAAVIVRAGPVRVGVGRVRPAAVRPVRRAAVRHTTRYRISNRRHAIHDHRVAAWNELLDAVQGP
jgi:hypothetical protein